MLPVAFLHSYNTGKDTRWQNRWPQNSGPSAGTHYPLTQRTVGLPPGDSAHNDKTSGKTAECCLRQPGLDTIITNG